MEILHFKQKKWQKDSFFNVPNGSAKNSSSYITKRKNVEKLINRRKKAQKEFTLPETAKSSNMECK